MSGTIGSNILSHSGIIAETAAGLSWSDTIVTGSTVTVEAGKGLIQHPMLVQLHYLVQQKRVIKLLLLIMLEIGELIVLH